MSPDFLQMRNRTQRVGMLLAWIWSMNILSTTHAGTYNEYLYDNTVQQFTPDGRLLQIEYASQAADHSSPLVIAKLSENVTCLVAVRQGRFMERLLVIEDSSTVVALSGVLADSLALFSKLTGDNLQFQRLYGQSMNVLQIVESICLNCQSSAFGGGIRPFGSTLIVIGLVGEVEKLSPSIVAAQTDPSGAFQPVDTQTVTLIGAKLMRTALTRRLGALALGHQDNVASATQLAAILRVLRDEYEQANPSQSQNYDVEVALISSDRGIVKLSPEEVDEIVRDDAAL